ncbi:MAG: hypothetical protein M3281_00160 [Chloroflexota bacterium]|nr:hypothetical protein [Chloroflexota bacterium]
MRTGARQIVLWGLVFGAGVAVIDTLMNVLGPQPTAQNVEELAGAIFGTLCLNFLISAILYYLSGYLASSFAGPRSAGQLTGLLAGVVAAVLGTLLFALVTSQSESTGLIVSWLLRGLMLNAPVGFIFGSIGAVVAGRRQ